MVGRRTNFEQSYAGRYAARLGRDTRNSLGLARLGLRRLNGSRRAFGIRDVRNGIKPRFQYDIRRPIMRLLRVESLTLAIQFELGLPAVFGAIARPTVYAAELRGPAL